MTFKECCAMFCPVAPKGETMRAPFPFISPPPSALVTKVSLQPYFSRVFRNTLDCEIGDNCQVQESGGSSCRVITPKTVA